MTGTRNALISRVLVAVDASQQGYSALQTAAGFAAHLQTHLLALFIEDVNLVKLAALPFATELDRSSGLMRPLQAGNVERALQADARKIQRRLAAESEKRSISVSMQVVRGHYVTAAMALAGESDIVFLSDAARLSIRRTGSAPRGRRARGTGVGPQPVWVFFDGSEAATRCLHLASSLSEKTGAELVVILAEIPDHDKLAQQVRRTLGSSPRFRLVSAVDDRTLIDWAQGLGCAVLVLPREIMQSRPEADEIISRIQYPRLLALA